MLDTPQDDVQPESGRVPLKPTAEIRVFYVFLVVHAAMTAGL